MYTVYCVKWEILIGGLLLISYAYVFQILVFFHWGWQKRGCGHISIYAFTKKNKVA